MLFTDFIHSNTYLFSNDFVISASFLRGILNRLVESQVDLSSGILSLTIQVMIGPIEDLYFEIDFKTLCFMIEALFVDTSELSNQVLEEL